MQQGICPVAAIVGHEVKNMIEGLENSPNLSVLFTVKPFLAALTKWQMIIFVLLEVDIFGFQSSRLAIRISSMQKGYDWSMLRLSNFHVRVAAWSLSSFLGRVCGADDDREASDVGSL